MIIECTVCYKENSEKIMAMLKEYDYEGAVRFYIEPSCRADSNGFIMDRICAEVSKQHDPIHEMQTFYRSLATGYEHALYDLGLLPYFNTEYQKDRPKFVSEYNLSYARKHGFISPVTLESDEDMNFWKED